MKDERPHNSTPGMPIETAPRDGSWVWLFAELHGEPHGHLGFWGEGGDWFDSEAASHSLTAFGWTPTRWQRWL